MEDMVEFSGNGMRFFQNGFQVHLHRVPGKPEHVSLLITNEDIEVIFSEPWLRPVEAFTKVAEHCVKR